LEEHIIIYSISVNSYLGTTVYNYCYAIIELRKIIIIYVTIKIFD